MRSALQRAKNPRRLVFGICWQIDQENDHHLFEHSPAELVDGQIRQIVVGYQEAGGPIYARYLIQNRLYRDEPFYLQIDSHTMFRQDFDEILLQEWELAKAMFPNPILSTYPHGYTAFGVESQADADAIFSQDPGPIRLELLGFDVNDGHLRIAGRPLVVSRSATGPVLHPFWAAGFSFSAGSIVADCPYDPLLFGIFFGEESVMAARLHTAGYDFVVPIKATVLTKWSRSYRHTFREIRSTPERERRARIAELRLALILGYPLPANNSQELAEASVDLKLYGLGSFRTLESFETSAGLQFSTKTVTNGLQPRRNCISVLITEHLGIAGNEFSQ